MKTRLLGFVCGMSLGWSSALAAGQMFMWVDKKGVVHVTDRLGDVPEPYNSMYQAKLKEEEELKKKREELKKNAPKPSPTKQTKPSPKPASKSQTTPSQTSQASDKVQLNNPPEGIVEREARKREEWRKLLATWRGRLEAATTKLDRLNRELSQARLNPILRETPQVKERIREIEDKRTKALEEVNEAKKMLMETLPARARRESVPPGWLLK